MKRELTKAPWLRTMTVDQFEAWWETGRISKEWFNLTDKQKARAADIKLLFRAIATRTDVDGGLIFVIMDLAGNLHRELIRLSAYENGGQSVWSEQHRRFLIALRTIRENLFASDSFKYASANLEPVVAKARHLPAVHIRQGVKNTLTSTNKPEVFIAGLVFLDSTPGAKSRYLRSFFACIFFEQLKTNHKGIVGRLIRFCFREKLTAVALKQARADFRKLFPNWRTIAEQLHNTLRNSMEPGIDHL